MSYNAVIVLTLWQAIRRHQK